MTGQHRKNLRDTLTLRATGGIVLGAALIGTVAATAQATAPMTMNAVSGQHLAAESGQNTRQSAASAQSVKQRKVVKKKAVKADSVISLAKAQVGTAEDRRGESKFGKWYANTPRAKQTTQRDGGGSPRVYTDAAWCSMFITWLGSQTGTNHQMGADAWTIKHAEWFKEKNRWGTKPKPGAVVFFDWKGGKRIGGIDHVGLVVKPRGDGKVETVEGNISNKVVSETRTSDKIVGYGYPEYA